MSEPTFVLVPGAGGAATWFWHRVAAELRERGFPSISVELSADDERTGLAAYVDEIVTAAGDLPDLVVVGMSLGGFSASLACPRLPVSRLVLLNAMIPAPGETAGTWWDATGQGDAMRANDARLGRAPGGDFDLDWYFWHDVPPEVVAEGADEEKEERGPTFDDAWDLPSWPDVPTRVVVGRDDRLFPAEFQRRVARARLGADVDLVEVPGGHMAALSHPVEVTEALLGP